MHSSPNAGKTRRIAALSLDMTRTARESSSGKPVALRLKVKALNVLLI